MWILIPCQKIYPQHIFQLLLALVNVENSVWFEEYTHDLNIDGYENSYEETWQEARSHYEEVFIPYG